METSFLFLDILAAIMPEPVKKTCDSLSQLVLLSLACNVKGAFWKLDFIYIKEKILILRHSKYSGFTHHQDNAREWKILLSLSSTCSL